MLANTSVDPTNPFELPPLPVSEKVLLHAVDSQLLLNARVALAELKGLTLNSPVDQRLLLAPLSLRESVASSQVENIATTMMEALQNQLLPEGERALPDKEVLHYREALMWGLVNLDSYALSNRLITGIQSELLPEERGVYRRGQNTLINSAKEVVYTPPLFTKIPDLMKNWEQFMNGEIGKDVDPVIRTIIGHYQFESIHPFNDGNGRTGRILMALGLVHEQVLFLPNLFISGYILDNRNDYYSSLRSVTYQHDWRGYISYMLRAFDKQARETSNTILAVTRLFWEQQEFLKQEHRGVYSLELLNALFRYPAITPTKLSQEIGVHRETASQYLHILASAGFLRKEKVGRYQIYGNYPLIKLLHAKK